MSLIDRFSQIICCDLVYKWTFGISVSRLDQVHGQDVKLSIILTEMSNNQKTKNLLFKSNWNLKMISSKLEAWKYL